MRNHYKYTPLEDIFYFFSGFEHILLFLLLLLIWVRALSFPIQILKIPPHFSSPHLPEPENEGHKNVVQPPWLGGEADVQQGVEAVEAVDVHVPAFQKKLLKHIPHGKSNFLFAPVAVVPFKKNGPVKYWDEHGCWNCQVLQRPNCLVVPGHAIGRARTGSEEGIFSIIFFVGICKLKLWYLRYAFFTLCRNTRSVGKCVPVVLFWEEEEFRFFFLLLLPWGEDQSQLQKFEICWFGSESDADSVPWSLHLQQHQAQRRKVVDRQSYQALIKK